MNINDFQSLPVIREIEDLGELLTLNYTAFPELGNWAGLNPSSLENFKRASRITARVLKSQTYQRGTWHERTFDLWVAVLFDGEFCLAIIRDPNKLSPYPTRFVYDKPIYLEMIKYLFSLIIPEDFGNSENQVEINFATMFSGGILTEPQQLPIPNFDEAEFEKATTFTAAHAL